MVCRQDVWGVDALAGQLNYTDTIQKYTPEIQHDQYDIYISLSLHSPPKIHLYISLIHQHGYSQVSIEAKSLLDDDPTGNALFSYA